MTAPRRVAVCGSCITRDNFNSRFNPDHRRWYSVVAQANQSSMIALMSPPVEPEVTEADGLSTYDTWNVRSDLSRSFLTDVVEGQPDYLILDFFGDVHFGVLEVPGGRFVTDNHWKLHRTAQYRAWTEAAAPPVIRMTAEPDRYFALWAEAMDRFAAHLAEHLPSTTVIVHRGFYAGAVVDGPLGRPVSLARFSSRPSRKVGRINKLWARLDEHAITTYGWKSIDLADDGYTSTSDHPWGPFWVHYSLDYYRRFLAELHTIDLAQRLPPEEGEIVAQVAGAGRELVARRKRFTRGAVRAQGERIRQLEKRGVARAVRDTLRSGKAEA